MTCTHLHRYPVLVRPSYVLSGAAMNVVTSQNELADYLEVCVFVMHLCTPVTKCVFCVCLYGLHACL